MSTAAATTGLRLSPVSCLWAVLGVAPMAVRRRWPWAAVASVLVYTCLPQLLPAMGTIVDSGGALMVVAYTTAAYLPLRQALTAVAVLWVPSTGVGLVTLSRAGDGPVTPEVTSSLSVPAVIAINTMLALVLFFIGRMVWTRRAYAAALEDRATVAEANQRALATQAVAEERRRIARELHDLVAHHISVMSVLASGARRALTRDPASADEALRTIEQTGRAVLREMRRLLDVLRADDGHPDNQLVPQPGLAAVVELIEQVRETGLPVRLSGDTGVDAVDPGTALTVYRIVQEALTNVIKHAGPSATVDVRLNIDDDVLDLEISDTGRGPRPDGARHGHGVLGMSERVALFGGRLRVGPRPGGGYRLHARIPLEHVGRPPPPTACS
ncbi:MAG: sensor histidine kinase [Dactylosporangium sp.]|nr:sensor histidine kinase [Dactylosporangium sp.]NNJ63467.1 sensor histidine kinase [Dactylosporangium sp.]